MSGTNVTCKAPPFMNTDIGGIGVRISFYLQTVFLAALSARSETLNEITGALSTLIASNLAMAVTALILGLKPEPEISFQDGLVVFYLLAMSWVTVYFSLPSFHRFPAGTKSLKLLSILQSYLSFTFSLVILVAAETFGNHPECNPIAVVVLFRPFSALKAGRILGWLVVGSVTVVYTAITAFDFLPPPSQLIQRWRTRRRAKDEQEQITMPQIGLPLNATLGEAGAPHPRDASPQPPEDILSSYEPNISGQLVVKLIAIFISWAMAVANTELLIKWNHLNQDPSAPSAWQFGQVLPMFLLVQPFLNLVSIFRAYKLRRWRNHGREG